MLARCGVALNHQRLQALDHDAATHLDGTGHTHGVSGDLGITAPKTVREVPIPEELTDALDADPELAEAFYALTPGRQKSYAFNLNSAKQSATRVARIAKFRDKIIAGKGALER